jgi:pyridoxamine 5'-phosphate oxidase
MTENAAPFYNDLGLSLSEARAIIAAGASNRRQAAHTPVVATIDAAGRPLQRVMILREVDWERRTLRFHTDSRSPKVTEADGAPVSVLFYDADAKVQLRVAGFGRILRDNAASQAAWEESTLFARRCYLATDAPGVVSSDPVSGLPDWVEGRQPTEEEIASARANFAILMVNFDRIEWLYLANSGHRRARWSWGGADWSGSWLVP